MTLIFSSRLINMQTSFLSELLASLSNPIPGAWVSIGMFPKLFPQLFKCYNWHSVGGPGQPSSQGQKLSAVAQMAMASSGPSPTHPSHFLAPDWSHCPWGSWFAYCNNTMTLNLILAVNTPVLKALEDPKS